MANSIPYQSEQQRLPASLPSLSTFHFNVINNSTSIETLATFVAKAHQTSTFSLTRHRIVNQNDDYIIKVQLVDLTQPTPFDVLMFFTHKLPSQNDQSFSLLRALLDIIFHPSNKLYGWTFNKEYLNGFVRRGYFTQTKIDQITIIDLSNRFKEWYNRTFEHQENCPIAFPMDDPSCICLHRPLKLITDKWSIYMAFKYVFRIRLFISDEIKCNPKLHIYYHLMVNQTVFHTFLMIVECNWDLAQLAQYKQALKR